MKTDYLFSYGTLQTPQVQLNTFGRTLNGQADVLEGYELAMLEITDKQVVASSGATHHPIITHTGQASDTIDGMVFELSEAELAKADEYEVDDYRRVLVLLRSGISAWVYVNHTEHGQP